MRVLKRVVDMVHFVVRNWLAFGVVCLSSACPVAAAERVRFNRDVLPILADRCFACHGFDNATRKAGLRLDHFAGATKRLESGTPSITPGDAANSELWKRLISDDPDVQMPPPKSGERLSVAQRNTLRNWIDQGADYEAHWAYIPESPRELPAERASGHPVDRYIRARLASEGILPSPRAERATLIRRLTLDLTGLPPAPLEVDAFVNDVRSDACERVVERLLGSRHFGERWARWWLDLAHYGDSDGYLQDFIRPVAWRYRQWVVEAFNRDLPFDQFTIEQLAGDLLPDATISQRIATGFLRNTLSNREGGADLEEYRVNQVVDRAVTTGTTWLGLTIGCAQCHDHKFDAFSQRDFYQFYAFFNDAEEVNFNAPLAGEREPWEVTKAEYDRRRAELLAPVATSLAELQADWEQRLLFAEANPGQDFSWDRALELIGLQWGQNLGEGQLEGINIIKTPLKLRTQDQRDRLLDYFLKAAPSALSEKLVPLKVQELNTGLDALAKTVRPVTRAPGMTKSPVPRRSYIHVRGDFRRRGDEVQPVTPGVLPSLNSAGEPDRLVLARWLTAPGNPLVARVTVNRLWQELFGRGIVGTSENFGVRGDLPSHPELLDWLASEFKSGNWSIKAILRHIVLSETYCQSSAARPELSIRDSRNTLVARQVRLRLSGEAIRDSALSASGLLSTTLGGPSVKPPQPASVSKEGYSNLWEPVTGPDRYRRGIYTFIQRTTPFAQFVTFDLPDTSRSCTRRERSNTPLQALNLLNDPTFFEAAAALAERIGRESPGSDMQRLRHAYLLTLAREPTKEESQYLVDYLLRQRSLLASDKMAASELLNRHRSLNEGESVVGAEWVVLCSVLLNLDEFVNRE